MAQPPAVFAETWNAEVDLLDNGIVDTPGSSFDFAHFENDELSARRLREYGQQLAHNAEKYDERIGECVTSLEALIRSRFCHADYRKQEIEAARARLGKLREQQEEDQAMIKRFQRENASLRTRLVTYEEDDEQRVKMEEEMRRAKREEEDRVRLQRSKLQQALDIAAGVSSPTVAQLRDRFDSPAPSRKRQPDNGTSSSAQQQSQQAPTRGRAGNENRGGPGFYNPKYRRSQSASRVIDHRPAVTIPAGTVFRARMPANSTKTTATPKADLLRAADGYVLTHQKLDDHGNLETSIIKGDCIPTAGGGTAVCFTDIEHLAHETPSDQNAVIREGGTGTEKRRGHRSSKKTVRF